jgi:hypothetical protein
MILPKYNQTMVIPGEPKRVFQWSARAILFDSNKWWMGEPDYWTHVEKPIDIEPVGDYLKWQNIENKKPLSGVKICVWTGEMFFSTTWISELGHTMPDCTFKLWSYVYETL